MKNEVLKTDKNNNFSLNSVNGGHSFLSKTNYDFLKYKGATVNCTVHLYLACTKLKLA